MTDVHPGWQYADLIADLAKRVARKRGVKIELPLPPELEVIAGLKPYQLDSLRESCTGAGQESASDYIGVPQQTYKNRLSTIYKKLRESGYGSNRYESPGRRACYLLGLYDGRVVSRDTPKNGVER